jgi:uncharacterized protein YdaU (DUF1376 family)
VPEYPALPIFVDAWAVDCAHLTDAEDGIYWRLCRLMWVMPNCRIPNDDAWIARRMSRSVEDVRRDVRPIISEFCQVDGNWVTQKRLLKEWNYVRKKAQKNSDSAKLRWNKEKDACERNAPRGNATGGNANAMPPHPHQRSYQGGNGVS